MSFRRELGRFDTTMVVVGGIIGAGIFINPYIVAQRLDSPALVLSAWLAGGVVALAGVEQIASRAQMRAIGQGLVLLAERVLGEGSAETSRPLSSAVDVAGALDAVEALLEEGDLDVLDPRRVGNLAEFRRFELAAALNRLRTLRVD